MTPYPFHIKDTELVQYCMQKSLLPQIYAMLELVRLSFLWHMTSHLYTQVCIWSCIVKTDLHGYRTCATNTSGG